MSETWLRVSSQVVKAAAGPNEIQLLPAKQKDIINAYLNFQCRGSLNLYQQPSYYGF